MDSFLDSCFWPIFLPIFDFFYWLICIKLTSIEKNKLRRFGVGSREELWRALIQQHVDNEREMQYEREMDALEYLQSHPELLEALRQSMNGTSTQNQGPPSDMNHGRA